MDNPENDEDLCREIANQIETVFDLDRPDNELLKTDLSKYGVTNYPKCHVHDILVLSIDGKLFYAKGENVYLRTSSRYSLSYKNFFEFALSIFELDDSSVPERTLCFSDEPEIAAVHFERALIQQNLSFIKSIADEMPPGSIQDSKIRQLFIFYLSRKERLVAKEGKIYDEVFNHHGRDVIHEILASAVGRLLGIPVPRNYFGYKLSPFKPLFTKETDSHGPNHHRYVLSRAIYDRHPCPSLFDVLNNKFRELDIIWGLPLYREKSNPLNLQFFQKREPSDLQDLGNLIITQCARCADLIRSDFLDQVLGGAKDRKPFDYLLPMGLEGPIFTVDFGEILFPELVFLPDEQHYLNKKYERAAALSDFFEQVRDLPADNLYRRTIAGLLFRVKKVGLDFIGRFINAIPETFLLDHFDVGQFCYQTETMIDFLESQFSLIAEQRDV